MKYFNEKENFKDISIIRNSPEKKNNNNITIFTINCT